eukprot:scaffold337302_cov37-Prasinocladus_malaysianus.AAC.1
MLTIGLPRASNSELIMPISGFLFVPGHNDTRAWLEQRRVQRPKNDNRLACVGLTVEEDARALLYEAAGPVKYRTLRTKNQHIYSSLPAFVMAFLHYCLIIMSGASEFSKTNKNLKISAFERPCWPTKGIQRPVKISHPKNLRPAHSALNAFRQSACLVHDTAFVHVHQVGELAGGRGRVLFTVVRVIAAVFGVWAAPHAAVRVLPAEVRVEVLCLPHPMRSAS